MLLGLLAPFDKHEMLEASFEFDVISFVMFSSHFHTALDSDMFNSHVHRVQYFYRTQVSRPVRSMGLVCLSQTLLILN